MANRRMDFVGGYIELVPAGKYTFPDEQSGQMRTVDVEKHVRVFSSLGRAKLSLRCVPSIVHLWESEPELCSWCGEE